MKQEFVLASGNRGKLREIRSMLEPLGFVVTAQSHWKVPEADETASTFVENALIKARNAAEHTSRAAIADDSGLVVPYLAGAPGIYSARYAGAGAGDLSNLQKLLDDLQHVTGSDRSAYFYCAMVSLASADDPVPLVATARWHGEILRSPRGDGGFGYDPVFRVDNPKKPGETCSSAELAPSDKDGVSHRGQALRELVRQLRERNDPC